MLGKDRRKMAMLIVGKPDTESKAKSDEAESDESESEYSQEDAMKEVAEMIIKAVKAEDAESLAEALQELCELT